MKGSTRCFSVYQGDMAPSLIAVEARAEPAESRWIEDSVRIESFLTGNGKNPLSIADDEMFTDIIIPIPARAFGSSYQKLRMRTARLTIHSHPRRSLSQSRKKE